MRCEPKLVNKRQRYASNKSPRAIFVLRSEMCGVANYGGENSNIWIRHLVQNSFHATINVQKNVPTKTTRIVSGCKCTGLTAEHERARSASLAKKCEKCQRFSCYVRLSQWTK